MAKGNKYLNWTLGSYILTFIGGAAVGTVAALLSAPKTGREARQQVGGWIRRGKENVEEMQEAARR